MRELARLRLDHTADAVPHVRQVVRDVLGGRSAASLAADAEIVVSELTTNALLHATLPIEVVVHAQDDRVRIAVRDSSSLIPVLGQSRPDSMTGRGLALVAALASQWGIERDAGGKVVWAELTLDGDVIAAGVEPDGDADTLLAAWPDLASPRQDGEEVRYTVFLGDVPTDLLLAAKAHVDNLLREFALALSGAASGATSSLPMHLADLVERVASRFAEARLSIKRQALAAAAAGLDRTELTLTLPVSAATAGLDYLLALDEADAYARAARLLTVETPPEHRAFRQWYVHSLVQQLESAAAGRRPPPSMSFERYVLSELRSVSQARWVADRAARLQAVTAALAAATTPADVAAVVVGEGVQALGASGGALLVPADEDHLAVPGTVGYLPELVEQLRAERRDAKLPAAHAMRTGEAVWLESRQERDERFPALTGLEPGTISMCAVPLTVGARVFGALRFSFGEQRLFDPHERNFVVALAAQTALALHRAQLFEVERTARERTAFLAEALELFTSSLDPRETLDHLHGLLVPALADRAVVYVDNGGPPPDDVVAEAVSSGRVVRAGDAIAVPLIARGTALGAVQLHRPSGPAFSVEEQQLVEDVAARAAIALQNASAYQRERDSVITLQRGLLPQQPPHVEGASFAWRYLPAEAGTHVGGDWYDVIDLERGRVAVVIGDVMGRGVEAAAVMGQLRATARAYASADLPPAEILRRLDRAVVRLEQAQITTAAFALIDPVLRTATIASAGHLPPLLVAPGTAPEYVDVTPGPPLGVGRPEYPETTLTLRVGDVLLLYTDGLVEDRLRPLDVGMATLAEAVAGATTPEEVCDRAVSVIGAHDGHDDIALLAVALDA